MKMTIQEILYILEVLKFGYPVTENDNERMNNMQAIENDDFHYITTVEIFHKWLQADKKWSDLLIKGLGGVVDKTQLEEAYAEFDKCRVMFWKQSGQKRTN